MELKLMLMRHKHQFLMIFIILFQVSVPSVKVFMKNHSALQFALSIVAFLMTIM